MNWKTLLRKLKAHGYTGPDTLDGVKEYIAEHNIEIKEDGETITDADLARSHKSYMRATMKPKDNGGAIIELDPEDSGESDDNSDDQKMDEDEEHGDQKAARYRVAKSIARANDRINAIEAHIKSGPTATVSLPGEREWKARKSRGEFHLDDAESAQMIGNLVLAQMGDKVPDRAAKARKDLAEWRTKAGGNTTLSVPDGSAIVDTELYRQIWYYPNAFGAFRDHAQNVPMNSGDGNYPKGSTVDGGGFAATWKVEGNAVDVSKLVMGTFGLYAREIEVLGKISRALMDDSVINLGEYAAQRIAEIIHKKIDDAGFNGDGTATHGGINGILNQFGATTAVTNSRSQIGGNTATATTEAQIRSVVSKLPSRYSRNAKWYGNRAAIVNIIDRLASDIAGGMTYREVQGEGPSVRFLGHEIVEVEVMPNAEDASGDQIDLLFGDLSAAAALGNRKELSIEFNQHRYWDEGNIGVKGDARVAINVHELGATDAGGPLVALYQT